MDLKEFLIQHNNNNTLDFIISGFQKSQYVENFNELTNFVKTILNKLMSDNEKQHVYNQLQSGGLAIHTTESENDINKKQSFCTDFNMMISNILGLLGFEFSKYLFIIFGAKLFIKRLIEDINNTTTYENILSLVMLISNFMSLGNSQNSVFIIDEKYLNEKYKHIISNNKETINYYSSESNHSSCFVIIQHILNDINMHIKIENIVSFNDDRELWYTMLKDVIDHTYTITYFVNNINDLIINLNKFNICYDNSFLKMFEILYNESYADIPHEFWNSYRPHVEYIEHELKLEVKTSKFLNIIVNYFHKIFDDTYKIASEDLNDSILKVEVTHEMYDLLANIVLNLFINIARKISNNQLIYAYFGKSTRIQFIQVFQAIIDCAPRLHVFSQSQRAILHYILLSDKVLNESLKNISLQK